MKLQELRTMGKELGVDSPTTYPKRELVLKIMEKNGIVVDQNDLPAPPKRRGGRQKKDRSQDALGLEEPTYAEPLAQEDIAVQVEEPGVQPLREAQSAAVLPLFSEDIKPAVSQMLSEGACGDLRGHPGDHRGRLRVPAHGKLPARRARRLRRHQPDPQVRPQDRRQDHGQDAAAEGQ